MFVELSLMIAPITQLTLCKSSVDVFVDVNINTDVDVVNVDADADVDVDMTSTSTSTSNSERPHKANIKMNNKSPLKKLAGQSPAIFFGDAPAKN